jgi:hypothetical protein
MRPHGVTLAVVRKGYKDDSDGDDSLSQRQQQLQASHLSQKQQLLQATAMIHRALMLVSSVAGVLLPKLQQSQQREQRQPSRFWYEDAHTWKIMVCTWTAARQAMVRVRYFLEGEDGSVDSKSGGWRLVHRRGHDGGLAWECRPLRRGCGTTPLGLSPTSFEALCACSCCGARLFIPLARATRRTDNSAYPPANGGGAALRRLRL